MGEGIENNYLLPRDQSEKQRLDEQHVYLRKFAYDDRLIYDKDVKIGPGSSVLDSGTGTVAWLLDLAKEVPETVELHGADVSPNNFPKDLPSNVHLTLASATSLPAEWSNKFDLANQRLLIAALLKTEWPVALAELYRVLKPGGAVQLCEFDPRFPLNKSPAMQRHSEMIFNLAEKKGLLRHCASHLPRMLHEAGFVNITDEEKLGPVGKFHGKWGEMGTRGPSAGAWRNMKDAVLREGFMTSGQEYDDLIDELIREWDAEGMHVTIRMVCARKPA